MVYSFPSDFLPAGVTNPVAKPTLTSWVCLFASNMLGITISESNWLDGRPFFEATRV